MTEEGWNLLMREVNASIEASINKAGLVGGFMVVLVEANKAHDNIHIGNSIPGDVMRDVCTLIANAQEENLDVISENTNEPG